MRAECTDLNHSIFLISLFHHAMLLPKEKNLSDNCAIAVFSTYMRMSALVFLFFWFFYHAPLLSKESYLYGNDAVFILFCQHTWRWSPRERMMDRGGVPHIHYQVCDNTCIDEDSAPASLNMLPSQQGAPKRSRDMQKITSWMFIFSLFNCKTYMCFLLYF